MRKFITFILIILPSFLFSQEYFQQQTDYKITVSLDDKTNTLNGNLEITYSNNSTDELNFIWMHLWPNAYKNNTTALAKQKLQNGDLDFYYATDDERGYISKLDFKVDNIPVEWHYHEQHIDICKLMLNKPLIPGEKIIITTPFFVQIPDAKFSRLGHVDQSYMITQWYPKPAVYDNEGWHEMPYLDQGEFYSEFGSFDVKITIPDNYTVGATGDLQNQDEIQRLNHIASITDTITKFNSDIDIPLSSNNTKTLHYKQNKIHDFAWFADKRFHVLKGKVILPYSKDSVVIWTMFTNNEANLWKNSIEYMHDALYYYSLWNGDYPYKHCTAVDGTISAGGGMEYPNVTVIGESGNAFLLEQVIMHEVGHNWFYGILGTNERDHPWMDEGINSFYENRYMETKYPEINILSSIMPRRLVKLLDLENLKNKQIMHETAYMMNAQFAKDQPIELHSSEYTPINYGGIVYGKAAIVFDYLMAYLGEEVFDSCMKDYYEKWKYRHPKPEDLKKIFEKKTGKNLSWFFKDMIQTTKLLDYAVCDIKKREDKLEITIRNKGEIAGPVSISGIKDNSKNNELWIDGFKGKKIIDYPLDEYDYIQIDKDLDMPEINRNNNAMRLNGIFKKVEPIKFQILASLNQGEKTQIFYTPSISWNVYSRFSYGLNMYNHAIPERGFYYKFTPLYSNGKSGVIGSLDLSYSSYSHYSMFNEIKFGFEANQNLYGREKEYYRLKPSIDLTFKKKSANSKINHSIYTSFIHINKYDTELEELERDLVEYKTSNFLNLIYYYNNNRTINPFSLQISSENNIDFNKLGVLFNYNYHLNKVKRISFRKYLGFMPRNNNYLYNIQMSAWNGTNDYTFEEKALGRSEIEGGYSQQLFVREGGIKHQTDINSNFFLSSLSIEYNLHKNIKLYSESGTNGSEIAYGIGIRLLFLRESLSLYLPIYTEKGLLLEQGYKNNIRYSIRGGLNLDLDLF